MLQVFTSGDICHPWHPDRFRYIASDISLYFPMPYECTDGNYYGMSNIWEARKFLADKRNAERSEELLRALLKHNRKVFNRIIPPTQRVDFAISLLYLGNIVPNPLYEQVLKKFYGGRKNATMLAAYSLVLRDLHSLIDSDGDIVKYPATEPFDMRLRGGIVNAKGVGELLNSVPDQEEFVRQFLHFNDLALERFCQHEYRCHFNNDEIAQDNWVEFAKWLVEQIYERISHRKSVVETLVPALADHIILYSNLNVWHSSKRDRWGQWIHYRQLSESVMAVFCTPWFRQVLRSHTFPWDSMDYNMTTRCRHGEIIDLITKNQQRDCTTIEDAAHLMESPQIQALIEALDSDDEE